MKKVCILFDNCGNVEKVYENKIDAYEEMVDKYIDFIENSITLTKEIGAEPLTLEEVAEDLRCLKDGFVYDLCSVEEHEICE